MDFILCERYGLKYLIIERVYPYECWTLTIRAYQHGFDEWEPPHKELNGMTVKVISNKEGLNMLRQYADDSVVGCRIKDFIKRYEALPF